MNYWCPKTPIDRFLMRRLRLRISALDSLPTSVKRAAGATALMVGCMKVKRYLERALGWFCWRGQPFVCIQIFTGHLF